MSSNLAQKETKPNFDWLVFVVITPSFDWSTVSLSVSLKIGFGFLRHSIFNRSVRRLRRCFTLCCLFNSYSILQPWLYEWRRHLLQVSPRQANLGRSIVPERKGKRYLDIVSQDIRGSFRTETGPYRKNRFNLDGPERSDHWGNIHLVWRY